MEPREHGYHDVVAGPRGAAPHLRWEWQPFEHLTPHALHAALRPRAQVFVLEQGCPFVDPDGYDAHAFHLFGWTHAAVPALGAYLRVLVPGTRFAEPSIGRVITAPPVRGSGLGRVVMNEGIRRTRAAFPGQAIRISAQERLRAFYESLGFAATGAPYHEDDILHIDMVLGA